MATQRPFERPPRIDRSPGAPRPFGWPARSADGARLGHHLGTFFLALAQQRGRYWPLFSRREEFLHATTHGVGAVLGAAAAALLLVLAARRGSLEHVIACGVFAASLVILYASSTLYHALPSPEAKRRLRVLDHCAIFLLIAGTYTPFAMISLPRFAGAALLAVVWGVAAAGAAIKLSARTLRERWSLALYLGLGWCALVVMPALIRSLGTAGVLLVLGGGVAYSVGVIFFVWKRLPYHHVIWHLFVLLGSGLHYAAVLLYVVPPS
jgi:hemolysin III